MLLVGVGAAIIHIDAGQSRGTYLAACWHADITAA